MILIYNEIEVGATIGICLEKEKSMENPYSFQIVDKTTKISMNVLMFWLFFKKNKPYG